jgi:homoserine O-acetyltransferase
MARTRTARWWIAALLMVPIAAGCSPPKRPDGTERAALRPVRDLVGVEKRMFTTKNFTLENGQTLPEMTLAYETYGRLAPDGRNAILITHGFTSNHHAAGRSAETDPQPGYWDGLIGPGKAIDTDRYFVVSSNMLGSSYGSTAPRSINPATGKPYGPDFPLVTLRDIVTAQKAMLDSLGVRHLVAVAGPSFGGYQAFQWAVTFPDHMSGIVPVVSAPRGSGGEQAVQTLLAQLARDPNWNGGWYYDRGGVAATLAAMRYDTLARYGYNEALAAAFPEPAARQAEMRRMAEAWAKQFDANSLVTLRRAAVRFNAERDFGKMRAKVLYVLSRTDKLFPPSIAPGVLDKFAAAGIDGRYFELDTDFGHSASGREWAKWAPALREFLARLEG